MTRPSTEPDGRSDDAAEHLRREADHRIANSLQMVSVMLRRDRARIAGDAAAEAVLDGAAVRVQAVADLHRLICRAPETGVVGLSDFLAPLCRGIEGGMGVRMDVRCSGSEAEAITLVPGVASRLAIVFIELAMNAARHGGRDDGSAALLVEIDGSPGGGRRITVRDDGRGLPDGYRLGDADGFGTSIMAAAMAGAGGTLRSLPPDGAGAGFEIELPRDAQENGADREPGQPLLI